ncbi:hypothetical protein ACEN9J_02790 [Variovorax sp. Varisp41]|uniref:hypothetical protein n=1 Tax=Variovorax sp. Varisp41 TaxID=3243033 RepID=UPI0039B3BE60
MPSPSQSLTREALIELVEERLTSVYHCTRVWQAWQYGTMSESDFVEARGTDLAPDIADAVLALSRPTPPEAQAGAGMEVTDEQIIDLADDYKSQYQHGGTTFDEFDYFGFARALLALAAPKAVAQGWQSIETAPKDELYRDGTNAYGEHILAWWPGTLKPARVRWWFSDSGASNFLADGGYAVFPTHWQPLPSAPSEEKKA